MATPDPSSQLSHGELPPFSIIVCTRDRPELLRHSLAALQKLDYPAYEVVVVDSASIGETTARVTAETSFCYVRDDEPGLDRARNRATAEARFDLIAYIDDDAQADPGWLRGLASAFSDPLVMAVTGLVVPAELETPAQRLFEQYGGMGKGLQARRFSGRTLPPQALISAHHVGVGTNMAYRRVVLEALGGFDPALDVGTPAGGAGDLDMFHRLLAEGYELQYEPSAIVYHRHRRDLPGLQRQITANGRSFGVYLLKLWHRRRPARGEVLRFALAWVNGWLLARLGQRLIGRLHFPLILILAEIWGALCAPLGLLAHIPWHPTAVKPAHWQPSDQSLHYAVRIALALVLLFGLFLRLWFAWTWNQGHPADASRLIGDEPGYDNLAREFLQGYGFLWPGRVPGYPLWLALVYGLTGGSYSSLVYAQAFLGVATIWLTYSLGRRLFGSAVGVIASGLAAVSYILIHQSLHLLSEVLYTPILLQVTCSLWDARQFPSTRRFAWAGFWFGLSTLVRPTLLFYPLAVAVVVLVDHRWLGALRFVAAYVLAGLVVMAPWTVHNWLRYQAVIPLQTSNAILWQGSPEYYHLVHDEGYTYERIWSEVLYGPDWQDHDPTSIAGDRYWTARAVQSIVAEPAVYVRFAFEKVFAFWIGDAGADWGDTYPFDYQALRAAGFPRNEAIAVMMARLLPAFALGAIVILRRQWRALLPVYGVLAYFTLFHAATHAEARLSDPLQPYLLILVPAACVLVVRSMQGRSTQQ